MPTAWNLIRSFAILANIVYALLISRYNNSAIIKKDISRFLYYVTVLNGYINALPKVCISWVLSLNRRIILIWYFRGKLFTSRFFVHEKGPSRTNTTGTGISWVSLTQNEKCCIHWQKKSNLIQFKEMKFRTNPEN